MSLLQSPCAGQFLPLIADGATQLASPRIRKVEQDARIEESPLDANCYLQMYGGLCVDEEQHGVCSLEPPNVFHPSPIPYCSVTSNARSFPIIYGKLAIGAAEHKFNATLGITSITCPESRLHEIISDSG